MVRSGLLISSITFILLLSACDDSPKVSSSPAKQKSTTKKVNRPNFNADSAYHFVEKQVSFGPRVPNTESHQMTKDYLSAKLEQYGFTLQNQEFKATAFNGQTLKLTNVIGSYQIENPNRILLFAHWDTRPFADQDVKDKNKPIDGANDGGSGVGVLLEVARQVQKVQPKIGLDIIFFDGEDYGQPSGGMTQRQARTWCLGSQHWGKTPHVPNYTARYGILLDMVGAKDAFFTKEGISMYYAPDVVEKVWNNALQLGHSKHFVFQETNHVGEDDHLYVNQLRNIPSIDIIQYDPDTRAFGKHWHTHEDNMNIIDKSTLQAVGETVLFTIFKE